MTANNPAAAQYFVHDSQTIAYEVMGEGPPLLLLHGFPQTRAMWSRIGPALARDYCVITADLRGYGDSSKPAQVAQMSFRAMGRDMRALMGHLGADRFHLVGHDRGARVAHRIALDAPQSVQSLTVMDIVPTHHLLAQVTQNVAKAYYHWFFLAQPTPFPETMIGHDPDAYFHRCLLGFGKARLSDFAPATLEIYRNAWRDPDCIRSMCHDYRAALEIDFHDDAEDLARRVECPSLVLYGEDGAMAQAMDVAATWAPRLANMQHAAMPGGHFFPDQSPEETVQALRAFLAKTP